MLTATKKQGLAKQPSTMERVSHGIFRQSNTVPNKNGTAPQRSHTELPQTPVGRCPRGLKACSCEYMRADVHGSAIHKNPTVGTA